MCRDVPGFMRRHRGGGVSVIPMALFRPTYAFCVGVKFSDPEDTNPGVAEIEAMRRGSSSLSDLEAAEILVDKVSSLLTTVATGGPQIPTVDAAYKREHRALAAVLRRLGVTYPNHFDDLWRWHGRWTEGDMPKYRDRRTFISDLFTPVRSALAELDATTHVLSAGVSEGPTGWPQIDAQMERLRKLFREAHDSDAYNGVGLQCVKILTALGHMVFDPARDLPEGEDEPGRDDAKARISLFVRRLVPGRTGESLRGLVNAAYAQANTAKHRHTATRVDAGAAANATSLIAATLRLLDESEGETGDDDLMSEFNPAGAR